MDKPPHGPTLSVLGILLLLAQASTRGAEPSRDGARDAFQAQVRPLLAKYCFGCHDQEKAKGELRLDTLVPSAGKPEAAEAWKKVRDRLDAATMPPRKSPQPNRDEKERIAKWVTEMLANQELADRQANGRVVLRRLNRVEYQNTMRDLFGTDVSVSEMLPPDISSHGFDNVAVAQQISPILMARYLDAADKVLDRFFGHGSKVPQASIGGFRYGKEPTVLRSVKNGGNWFMPYKNDAAVIFLCYDGYRSEFYVNQFVPKHAGEYRIRVSMSTYQANGGKIPVKVIGGNLIGGELPGTSNEYYDVTSDEPQTIEFTRYLHEGERFGFLPENLWIPDKQKPSEYKGRGLAIYWYEVEGPLPETGPYPSYRRLLGDLDLKKGTLGDVEPVLRRLLPRAFRRPISDEDVRYFMTVASNRMKTGSFVDGLRAALKAVLCSPEFLFFLEEPGSLDDFAVASRLSYFLWSAPPDEELVQLALERKLRSPEVLHRQVERMLQSPKASEFTANFLGQWLELRRMEATFPDEHLYREYEESLKLAMLKETRLFFEELLKNDLSILNIIDSDFTMLNRRLALHYGIKGVDDLKFSRVKLPPDSHRGGLLTHASILKITANGTTTSPVQRGVWVLKNLFGDPMPPPPPDVPAIQPDTRGATTIRQQLTKHRENQACAGCHRKIDPVGFALESFDVIGGWRDRFRTHGPQRTALVEIPLFYGGTHKVWVGAKVDVGDVMPDGQQFRDIDEFKKIILAKPEPIVRNLVRKLTIYATGCPPTVADEQVIDEILKRIEVKNARGQTHGLRSLVHAVVQCRLFLTK